MADHEKIFQLGQHGLHAYQPGLGGEHPTLMRALPIAGVADVGDRGGDVPHFNPIGKTGKTLVDYGDHLVTDLLLLCLILPAISIERFPIGHV